MLEGKSTHNDGQLDPGVQRSGDAVRERDSRTFFPTSSRWLAIPGQFGQLLLGQTALNAQAGNQVAESGWRSSSSSWTGYWKRNTMNTAAVSERNAIIACTPDTRHHHFSQSSHVFLPAQHWLELDLCLGLPAVGVRPLVGF